MHPEEPAPAATVAIFGGYLGSGQALQGNDAGKEEDLPAFETASTVR
jgi:hypothetical protein